MSRFASLIGGIIYTVFYVGFAVQFYHEMESFDFSDMESYNSFDMLKNMFFAYSLILHAPIIPINLMIIIKEI